MGNYNFNIIEQSQVGQRIDKLVSDLNKIGHVVNFKIGLKKV